MIIKRIVILVVLIFGLLVAFRIFSRNKIETTQKSILSMSVCDDVVKRNDFVPVKVFTGTPAKVNFLKDEWLNKFHTTVLEQVSKGSNFAGHFTFVYWGCGTSCISFAIIDTVTGERVIVNNSEVVEELSPSFNINSRLLVFNSKEGYEYLRGKTLDEITAIDPVNNPSEKSREYYELIEEKDGHIWLHKLCSENVLDGIYNF